MKKILVSSSEDIDCDRILSAIHSDPWLHNGGIIAIAKILPKLKSQNLE